MEGFLLPDYFHLRHLAESVLRRWLDQGLLRAPSHIVEGFENAPQALLDLLAGVNRGKVMVRICGAAK